MYRRNLYDLLSNMELDIRKEYNVLSELFERERIGYWESLLEYVDKNYFRTLPFRQSFTSVKAFLAELKRPLYCEQLEDLLLFCEALIALLPDSKFVITSASIQAQVKTIKGNIFYILEKANYELFEIKKDCFIIVEKNKYAKQAAILVDDPDVAVKLIEYNYFAIKGDLQKKKNILFALSNYIEPILKSRELENSGYKQLQSDVGFLLNNFNVRHNNKEGAKAQDYIVSLSDDQLEEWYDSIYNAVLSVLIIKEHLPIQSGIQKLKNDYIWKS